MTTPSPSRGDLEGVGQAVGIDDERVVAPDGQRRRQAGEDRAAVVRDLARLAVDRLAADDEAAERLRERLVAEADAERRDPGLREAAHRLQRDAGLVGRARPGRDDDAIGRALEQLVDRRDVVAHDVQLRAQLAEELDEVVGERVVVVDDEDGGHARHGQSGCWEASSTARSTARALASDSANS